MKVLVGTFNQEKALVGAFSMIVKSSGTFVSSSSQYQTSRVQLVCLQSPDTVSRFKTVGNNVILYVGLIGYTAIGAKVLHI